MSMVQKPLGSDPFSASPVTPGTLGRNDAADPATPDWFVGDTPGPLGHGDYADPKHSGARFTWSNHVLLASNEPMVPAPAPKNAGATLPGVVHGPAFISVDAHPSAPDFYAMFPMEPLLPNSQYQVTSIVPLKNVSLKSLLDAILKAKSTDILIVSHGQAAGLSIPLVPGSKEVLGEKALDTFAGKLPDFNLPLKKEALEALKRQIRQVQGIGLRLVAFRSCTVGTYPDVLEKLRAFFNCQVACGPSAMDGHGRINVGPPATADVIEKWLKHHNGAFVEFEAPNRFVWTPSYPSLIAEAIVESKKAVNDWVNKHMPGAVRQIGQIFPYHAFLVGSNQVIFPGDSDYKKQLQRTP